MTIYKCPLCGHTLPDMVYWITREYTRFERICPDCAWQGAEDEARKEEIV